MVFVTIGLLVGPRVLDGIDLSTGSSTVRVLAEATLALVLFADASRLNPPERKRVTLQAPRLRLSPQPPELGAVLDISRGRRAHPCIEGLSGASETCSLPRRVRRLLEVRLPLSANAVARSSLLN